MTSYIIFIRGINVGGKNKVSMAELKVCLEKLGYTTVSSYINSGNIILTSHHNATYIKNEVERILPQNFSLDDELIKVLVVSQQQLEAVVLNKPSHFGEQPDIYHSDVIFLIDIPTSEAMRVFSPREGVDAIWQGEGVIYSQRLSAERTKSRLNKIMGSPLYKSMTVRNWNTTTKLLHILDNQER